MSAAEWVFLAFLLGVLTGLGAVAVFLVLAKNRGF